MSYEKLKLDEEIDRMKNMGDLLIPYNFPLGDPTWEDDLNFLKITDCTVDGYGMILHFSKAKYENHYLETLQVMSKDAPFLPFNLVAKLAQKILGGHRLSLVEMLRGSRKIYCWTLLVDEAGKPMKSNLEESESVEMCVYEGFEYGYIDPTTVNFY